VTDSIKRRRRVALAAGAVVILVAAGGWLAVRTRGDDPPTLYGNVDIRDVALAFRVPGRIAALDVDEGDRVTAGQVLARLDAVPLERELRESSANAAALRARLTLLRSGYRPEEVAQARATVVERRAALDNADQLLARQTELRGTGAIAARTYDDAVAARDEARARLVAAEQVLTQYQAGYRRQEVAEAEANTARAEALVAQSELRVEDAVLRSPSDGVVLTRAVEKGAMVVTGATVYTVSLTRPVWVRAYAAEPDLGRVVPGRSVEVYTDARPGRPYRGRIGYVSPAAEFTPKNVETPDLRTSLVYRFRVIVDDPDDALRQGMPVTVRLGPAPASAAP
jgi:HlyD family secretion protein